MKKYPTYRLVFDRRKSASKDKKGSVDLEVLFQGKRKWFSQELVFIQVSGAIKLKSKQLQQINGKKAVSLELDTTFVTGYCYHL